MFSTLAWAQAAPAAGPTFLEQMMPFVFVFIIFYFLLIRPQAKKQKTQLAFMDSLKRGDSVLTSGGILGTIEGITEQFVTLEVANGVRIRILKNQIASPAQTSEDKK